MSGYSTAFLPIAIRGGLLGPLAMIRCVSMRLCELDLRPQLQDAPSCNVYMFCVCTAHMKLGYIGDFVVF